MKAGKKVVLFGKVSPTQGSMTLSIQRKGQKITKRVPLVNSTFKHTIRPKVKGRYSVVATYAPASSQTDFLGNKSNARVFRVR